MVASGKSGVEGGAGGADSAVTRKASGPVVMKNGVRVGGYDPGEIPQEYHGEYLLHEGRLYQPRKIGSEAIPEVKRHLLAKRGNVLEKVAKQLDGADVSGVIQGAMIREAIREATSSQVTNTELTEFMASADGGAFVLWLSLRDSMDGLTLEKAEQLFFEVTEQEAVRKAEMDKAAREMAKGGGAGGEKSSDGNGDRSGGESASGKADESGENQDDADSLKESQR